MFTFSSTREDEEGETEGDNYLQLQDANSSGPTRASGQEAARDGQRSRMLRGMFVRVCSVQSGEERIGSAGVTTGCTPGGSGSAHVERS